MKGQLQVATPEEYLANVEESRRADVTALDAMVRKHAPELKPLIHSGMLADGPWHYKYDVAEGFKEALPKASIGKSCVRFKRLSDLDPAALTRLIEAGAK
jgi:hypothetical protein